ncbi:diguanylate cyclase [Thalassotalea atypica]|uniref:diguanylate cyclase n=1 Tax=Thalassotalea atypica TaxID=2054316 RepID=UPI0025747D94|nr:diguanylate cyclase [Thalassotalea atypica]
MSEQLVVTRQLKIAKEKLDTAIKSRALLEEDFNAQTTLLTTFIGKLSKICKGIDLELDNRLAKLRALLKKSAPISEIEKEIETISKIINQHASKNERHIRDMHEQLHVAGKTLQKVNGLPNDVRRNLRKLLNDNPDHKEALIQYIPKLNELIDLYGQAIGNKLVLSETRQNQKSAQASDSEGEHAASKSDALSNNHVLREIIRILSDIQLSDKQLEKLNKLKSNLSTELGADELLETLLTIFNIIIEDMRIERKVAKSFLSSLSKALATVQSSVCETMDSTSSYQTQQKKINSELSKQLSELTQTVEQSPSLTEVKDEIQNQLLTIASTINNKSDVELSHFTLLNEQLNSMQEKVDLLEKQSKTFEKRLAEQKQKSLRDALTKLHNRAAFDEYFSYNMVKFHHQPFDLAIVVLDLDNFKRINDTYGHTAGDKTLQVIANILKSSIDDSVFIARYGGEEFVLIYSGVNQTALLKSLDTLRKKIAKLPFKFKNTKVNISASFGATHVNVSDNIHTAFERADTGLYQAKEQGKNKVIYL